MQTRTVQSTAFPSQFSQGHSLARDVYGRVQYPPPDPGTRHTYSAPSVPIPEQYMTERQQQYYNYSAPQPTTNYSVPSTQSQSQYGMQHHNRQSGQSYSDQHTNRSFAYPSGPPATGEQAYYWSHQGITHPDNYYQRQARVPVTITSLTSTQHELHMLTNTMHLQSDLLSFNPLTAPMVLMT